MITNHITGNSQLTKAVTHMHRPSVKYSNKVNAENLEANHCK